MLTLLLALPTGTGSAVTPTQPPATYVADPIVYGFYETRPLDTFMPLIMPHAKGAPIPTVYAAIRNAAIQFCERTRLWRWTDEFDVNHAQCEQIDTPRDSVIFEIERIRFNGTSLMPISTAQLDDDYPHLSWENYNTNGIPQYYTQREEGSVMIGPRATGLLRWDLFLKPHPEALSLPKFMADNYRQVIAEGALGYLLMTPEQPFSNPDLATFYQMKFSSRLDTLSTKKSTGQQRAHVRVRPNWF